MPLLPQERRFFYSRVLQYASSFSRARQQTSLISGANRAPIPSIMIRSASSQVPVHCSHQIYKPLIEPACPFVYNNQLKLVSNGKEDFEMSEKTRNIIIGVVVLVLLALIACLVFGLSKKNEPTAPVAITPEVTVAPEVTAAPAEEATEAPAEETAEAPAEEAAEAPAEETADTVAETAETPAEPVLLVTVNGQEIMSDNDYLNAVITQYEGQAESNGYDVTSPEIIEAIRQYSLKYTLHSTLLHQKATELGMDTITDEEKAKIEAEAKEEWDSIVESYATQSGLMSDESTEEEKVAARAQIEASFLTIGYDEARFVRETVEGQMENTMANRLMDYLTADKSVTEEEIQNYFNDLVSEDRETYADNVDMYEFYTNYYGQTSYYVPEGYRGITHILLTVDEQLLDTWKDLSARLEEQKADASAEATDEEAAPADTEVAETAAPAEAESAETAAPADAESTETAVPAEAESTPEPTPEPVTQEMVDAAEKAILDSVQSTVDEIKAKIADGVSFDDLIKEYGTDPGMQQDATRAEGYHVHKDSIVWDPAFTAAAMALEKVGDISEPFVGQYGVHILQYLKDIPAGATELTNEMKEEFREKLQDEMRNTALNDALEQWEKEANIVYTEEGEKWKLPEEDETDEAVAEEAAEPATEEPAAEPAAEEPAAEPAAEATANP